MQGAGRDGCGRSGQTVTEPGGRDNISIASASLGAAQPRNPSGGRRRSAPAAEWARGSRPLPSRVGPPLSLPNPLRLPLRPGLRRPPPSANPAVNERPAPPGAGCRRRGLPGGARPAKMYGKEGSLPPGWQTCRTRTIVPLRGPGEARGCGLGARLGSPCRSVCARLRWEDKDAQDRRPGVLVLLRAACLRALGRVGGGPSGCGGALGIRGSWVSGKASLPWCRGDRGCWWRWSCDSIFRINKSRLCWGVLCGMPVRNCGETLTGCLVRAPRMWEAAPTVQGLASEPVLGDWSRRPWMDLASAPPCRAWDPSSRTSGYALSRAKGERRCRECQVALGGHLCHPISLAPFHGHPLN